MNQGTEQLGPYRVVRFLGAGGAGAVYEAEHTTMGTRHALKVLGEHVRHNAAVRERLRREAQLMFDLGTHHRHIVRATDLVEEGGALALVIDYVDGGDLGQALAERPGGLPWAEAWRILRPIVSAVAYAHRRGVVHRDLKPENVLLQRDGTWPGTPLVADFGIARDLGADSATRTQSRMGTPGYSAPEQFRSARQAGPEADVWALGMLAWRLVNGHLPVDPDDNLAVIRLHEGLSPIPPLVDVPGHVSRAVSAALTLDPTRRPRDAGVLEQQLSASDSPLDAASAKAFSPVSQLAPPLPSQPPPPKPGPHPKRHRWGLVVGGALLLSTLIALLDKPRTDAALWVEFMELVAEHEDGCDALMERLTPFVAEHGPTLRRIAPRSWRSEPAFEQELRDRADDWATLEDAAGEGFGICAFHPGFGKLVAKAML
jgi:serine/threonine protein kinase